MPAVTNLCCILTCPNRYGYNINLKKHSLFRFPKELQRCAIWLKHCGRADLQSLSPEELHKKNYRVCSLHFAGEMFAGVRLKRFAFPTIKGGQTTTPVASIAVQVQESSTQEIVHEVQEVVSNEPDVYVNHPQEIPLETENVVSDHHTENETPSVMIPLPSLSPLEPCDYWYRIP